MDTSPLCKPFAGHFWFGVHPPIRYHQYEMDVTSGSIESINQTIGKMPAIITFSHEWGINTSFPSEQFSSILSAGATPWVRLMLRTDISQFKKEQRFTFNRILNGAFDDLFRQWAQKARELNHPIFVEYGTEVNGYWFSWNGYWNGKELGAERFQRVYQHIHQVMRAENATNLIWVYHINWDNNPREPWNTAAAYYPGDEYVDVFGISAYGALNPHSTDALPFFDMVDDSYLEVMAINSSKPVIIAETGTDINNIITNPESWTKSAIFNVTNNTWPQIIGMIWWNSEWPNDRDPPNNSVMRIEKNDRLRDIFREYVGNDSRFLDSVQTGC
jgi:hypothetical protein